MSAGEGLVDQAGDEGPLLVDHVFRRLSEVDEEVRRDVVGVLLTAAAVCWKHALGGRVTILEAMRQLDVVEEFLEATKVGR